MVGNDIQYNSSNFVSKTVYYCPVHDYSISCSPEEDNIRLDRRCPFCGMKLIKATYLYSYDSGIDISKTKEKSKWQ